MECLFNFGVYMKKEKKVAPKKFTKLQVMIFELLLYLDIPRFPKLSVADFYLKQWNFINYCIIGGIGVLINYFVFFCFIGTLPWFVTNVIAILSAMTWNWINSVGSLCVYWGYTKNE
jgi:hypothetical protein